MVVIADSLLKEFDVDFDGLAVHCYEGGEGFPILLLHGSGAGTSSVSNWALVLEELARNYHILAADLIGFGRSARKPEQPYFDVDLWMRQAQFLLDRIAGGRAVGLIAHSLSGFLALRLAAKNVNVTKVAVTGCPGAPFALPKALDIAWSFPNSVNDLKHMYACVVAEPLALSEEFFERRMEILNSNGYAQYFSAMFAGDKQAYLSQLVLTTGELSAIRARVLFIHGAEDQIVPFLESPRLLMASLKEADAVLLGRCGHGPALEQPVKFMQAIHGLFG